MAMIPGPKLIVGMMMLSAVLIGQPLPVIKKQRSVDRMNQEIEVTWNAAKDKTEDRQEVYFMYSTGHGLTDIDFHSITAREWSAMKSPSANAVARIQVEKQTTLAQVEEVIRQVADKGGYTKIVVTTR